MAGDQTQQALASAGLADMRPVCRALLRRLKQRGDGSFEQASERYASSVEPVLDEGTKLTKSSIEEINFRRVDLSTFKVQNSEASERIRRIIDINRLGKICFGRIFEDKILIIINLKLNKIDEKTMKLKSYKKMKTTTMWLSDDQERLPMEFRVDAFIGDVRAVLDGYRYLN